MKQKKYDYTKENIDKVIRCRQIIDDCRDYKHKVREELQVTDPTLMQAQFISATTNRDSQLIAEGFNTLTEFQEFNEDMCLLAIQETIPLESTCDNCEGYDGPAPCSVTCGSGAYAISWTGSEKDYENFWIFALAVWRMYQFDDKGNYSQVNEYGNVISATAGNLKDGVFGICPPGRGFIHKFKSMPPFDLKW
jgi:hypothetical protein